MTKPRGKRVVIPRAVRPWNLEELRPDTETSTRRETARQRLERETCLHCSLPDCPSVLCPLFGDPDRQEPPGRQRKGPTEDFLDWAWGPKTNREWAEEFGVSTTTIREWKKKYAEEIDARRKKRRP